MDKLVITKYSSGRSLYRDYFFNKKEFTEEYKADVLDINGIYFKEIEHLLAVLSHHNKNYIVIKDKLLELNSDILIKYYCEQNKTENSWIKIYQKNNLLLDVTYKNNREPFINPFDGCDDWEVVNWGFHLVGYANKVRENSEIVLFPL